MAARTSRLMHSGCHVLADACHSTQVQARSLLCGDDFASAGHVMASSACKRKLHDGRAQLAAFSPAIFSAISQLLSLRSQHAAASMVCVTLLCVVYPLQAALTAAPSPLWSMTCCSDACFYHMLKPKGNGNSQD